jgi:N-terminal half of MaoC dehydratase
MSRLKQYVGVTYGPHVYQVSTEKMREFTLAVCGGVPSAAYGRDGSPGGGSDLYLNPKDADGSPLPMVAMPNFAVVFALGVFAEACADPRLGLDLLRLVHGEQSFEFLQPIHAGDVISTRATIVDAYEKAQKTFLVVETVSTNQHRQPAVIGRWTAVIRG